MELNNEITRMYTAIAVHLAKQRKVSTSGDGIGCMYRDGEGNACAVGCLMTDSYYKAILHQFSYARVESVYAAGLPFLLLDDLHRQYAPDTDKQGFIRALMVAQHYHDNYYYTQDLEQHGALPNEELGGLIYDRLCRAFENEAP